MTKTAEQLLSEAMKLDEEDREELVDKLRDTLEPSIDPQYVAEWEAEIASRLEAHEKGESKSLPWTEARRQMFGDEKTGA